MQFPPITQPITIEIAQRAYNKSLKTADAGKLDFEAVVAKAIRDDKE